jgi:hypothetical protein
MAHTPAKKSKTFIPNWDEIMKVLGHPKQEAVFVNRSLDPESMDGSWDMAAAQKGLGMRRVAADIGKSNTEIQTPCGFVFVCECGYARRVVDSEFSFTCERPNASGQKGCGIIWQVELTLGDDIDPKTGEFKKVPLYTQRKSIGKMQRDYMMPNITGMYIADMRRETALARKAAGQPSASEMQPQTFGEEKKGDRRAWPPKPTEPFVVPDAPKPVVGGEE